MKKILFVQPTTSTFMNIDYEIFSSKYPTDRLILHQDSKIKYFINLFKLLLKIPFLRKYDLFVTWFGDYHSAILAFISTVLHKKLMLFVGGYDAVYYPKEHIGVYTKPVRGAFTRYAVTHADLIIANHESLIEYTNTYIDGTQKKSGLKNILSNFQTPFLIIHNGIDTTRQIPTGIAKQPKLVLTVGSTPTWIDVYNKGYDLLIQAARLLPDFRFVFVNVGEAWLEKMQQEFHYRDLSNITIHPFIPQADLYKLFTSAQIYAQPSLSEGMPNALAEAMLFGCIPVGSNVAGIPTVIDKYGVIINKRSAEDLAEAIKQASELKTGEAAAEYIRNTFSIPLRAEQVIAAIESIKDR